MAVLPSIITDNDVEFHGFTLARTQLHLVPAVVLCSGCLVDEDVLPDVVAIVEAVPILNVKPSNGSKQSPISVSAHMDKAALHFLTLSCGILILRQCLVVSCPIALDGFDKPADLQVMILETWSLVVCLQLVSLREQGGFSLAIGMHHQVYNSESFSATLPSFCRRT